MKPIIACLADTDAALGGIGALLQSCNAVARIIVGGIMWTGLMMWYPTSMLLYSGTWEALASITMTTWCLHLDITAWTRDTNWAIFW